MAHLIRFFSWQISVNVHVYVINDEMKIHVLLLSHVFFFGTLTRIHIYPQLSWSTQTDLKFHWSLSLMKFSSTVYSRIPRNSFDKSFLRWNNKIDNRELIWKRQLFISWNKMKYLHEIYIQYIKYLLLSPSIIFTFKK